MWVRVTCPNGHSLRIETKYIGRNNRCPKCGAAVALWIQVLCPNGHSLKVKSKFAGRSGHCPECNEPVRVPDITEVIAMDTLGPALGGDTSIHSESDQDTSVLSGESSVASSSVLSSKLDTTRTCPACRADIAKSYRTCPHCGKYIGEAEQVAVAGGSVMGTSTKCPECEATSFPGDAYCSSCGTPLREG